MKFTKDVLNNLEYIELTLENCECFRVAAEDVIDLWTSEIESKSDDTFSADDGGLVISKNAFQNLSTFATMTMADGTRLIDKEPDEMYYLYNRITHCCDICAIDYKLKGKKPVSVYIQYDPLESHTTGAEIDYSNCPSAELNEDGNLLILFGESSHSRRRVDNNYSDLIIGLSDIVKMPIDEEMQVEVEEFSNLDRPHLCPRFYFQVALKNKGCRYRALLFVFHDVRDVDYEMHFYDERNLWMSRISPDEIFVEFEDFVSFRCSAITASIPYSGRSNEGGKLQGDDICERALNCALNESDIKLFAENYADEYETDFSLAEFTAAKEKALNGEISAEYFRYWLKAYSEMVYLYQENRSLEDSFHNVLLTMMDRLQIKLSYPLDWSDCKQLIVSAADELEKYCNKNSQKATC